MSRGETLEVRASTVRIEVRERTGERGHHAMILAGPDGLQQRAHEALLRCEPLLEEPDRARPTLRQRACKGIRRSEAYFIARCGGLAVDEDAREALEAAVVHAAEPH